MHVYTNDVVISQSNSIANIKNTFLNIKNDSMHHARDVCEAIGDRMILHFS